MLKTFEEIDDDLCSYCYRTDYGENKSYCTPNGGYYSCEGTWCGESYDIYLEDNNATENMVKYQNKVKLLNKEDIDWVHQ